MPPASRLLALDLLTLREHTERAGDRLDPELHAAQLRQSLQISQVCAVRREGELVAYAMLSSSRPVAGSSGHSIRIRGTAHRPS